MIVMVIAVIVPKWWKYHPAMIVGVIVVEPVKVIMDILVIIHLIHHHHRRNLRIINIVPRGNKIMLPWNNLNQLYKSLITQHQQ